jgi:hypothetical protein
MAPAVDVIVPIKQRRGHPRKRPAKLRVRYMLPHSLTPLICSKYNYLDAK